jgi:hypothetical protein
MRPTRLGSVGLVLIVTVASFGCDRRDAHALLAPIGDEWAEGIEVAGYEKLRQELLHQTGPVIISSIVAASAPPGGPVGLSTFCADARWRMGMARPEAGLVRIPSVLELPDPRVQFSPDGREFTIRPRVGD